MRFLYAWDEYKVFFVFNVWYVKFLLAINWVEKRSKHSQHSLNIILYWRNHWLKGLGMNVYLQPIL